MKSLTTSSLVGPCTSSCVQYMIVIRFMQLHELFYLSYEDLIQFLINWWNVPTFLGSHLLLEARRCLIVQLLETTSRIHPATDMPG